MGNETNMLEIKNLGISLGAFSLDNFSLSFKPHEYFVLLGPTGTGKSVVLETIAGFHMPDQGEIYWDGQNITRLHPSLRSVGFVYQDYMLFPHLNVWENIAFGLRLRKLSEKVIRKKISEAVDMLNIGHLLNRRTVALSGGEQQRVAIARAIVTEPRILLLDEPFSALDPGTREELHENIKKIHQELNTLTIHITHDFSEALVLADRIGVMHQGRMVQVGCPEAVFQQPENDFVARFIGVENIFEGMAEKEGTSTVVKMNHVRLYTSGNWQGRVRLAIRPEDIILSSADITSSARNRMPGVITELSNRGSLVKVHIDVGIPLVALVTRNSAEELGLAAGRSVYAVFKSTAVHIFH